MSVSRSEGSRLDRTLLALGLLDESRLLQLLAKFLGIEFRSENADASQQLIGDPLDAAYCGRNFVAPIELSEGRTKILSADPANADLLRELTFLLGTHIDLIATPRPIVQKFLEGSTPDEAAMETSTEQSERDAERFRQIAADGPVIAFVNSVLGNAVEACASDIHFESTEDSFRVRFRVNGLLKPHPINRTLNPSAIFARLKVLSGMNVTERRRPQDGRIRFTHAGRSIDFRASSVPTQFGESTVCRVLDPRTLNRSWAQLGFDPQTEHWITQTIERPSGLFLVTGPTGSGKTTTLYTALSQLNNPTRKIITVEDPVEYNLPGIEQMQVHEKIGLSFARALRAILRQDPNVIMIGEIRDEETAAMACRAALIGRMVLSTLHTSDPKTALPRLKDFGVPEYLIRDVLVGVLGQKLEIGEERRLVVERWGNPP